jgi:hypothetical protein
LWNLLENIAQSSSQYDLARSSIVKKFNTERIAKDQIFWVGLKCDKEYVMI